MPRSSANDDPRFQKAVRKNIENKTITVPDATKCADFTSDEIKIKSLNQRIHRAADKAHGGQKPSSITVDASMMSSASTVTATPPLKTKLKAKKVHYSSAAAQQIRKNNLVDKEKKEQATKHATQLNADSQKPGEKQLSGREVKEIVEKKLDVSVSKRIIQKHRITVPHGQERIDAISKAATHGKIYANWTDADEQNFLTLTTKPISIGDTSLGRLRTVKRMEVHAAINHMSKEEREEIN
eukprot:scaffold3530_cov90-Skeletonema_dohrnii-CCMP3373.AAC.1